jgi:hypothetical protein
VRSFLVFEAAKKIENRFLLSSTAMKATRKLHMPSTRTEDTVNRVLNEVAKGGRVISALPEVAPPPVIEELITPAL